MHQTRTLPCYAWTMTLRRPIRVSSIGSASRRSWIGSSSHVFLRSVLSLGIADDLTPSIRFEHNPACRLIASTPEGYLLHSCATEHGTSGVPMFQRGADGRLRVIGVHTGATEGLTTSPQWRACQNRAENYGVRPSRAKISAAMGKPEN